MFTGLLDLLFPRACSACGARPCAGPFCQGCSTRLEVPPVFRCPRCAGPLPLPGWNAPRVAGLCPDCLADPPAFSAVRVPFTHGGAASEAVHRLKYRGRREVARTLGPLLAAAARADKRQLDAVAPIPLHPARRRERGFDQAALLARALARQLAIPYRGDLLQRARPTAHQVGLDRLERQRNLAGAFLAAAAAGGLRIALVDDVITTGATARAAARALLDAGASEVRVVAVARAGH